MAFIVYNIGALQVAFHVIQQFLTWGHFLGRFGVVRFGIEPAKVLFFLRLAFFAF
jgi:hypothetical protein